MSSFNVQKYITHPVQGMIAHTLFFVMGLLPIDLASAIGGAIARTIGPKLKVTRIARDNLQKAFPDKTAQEIEQIIFKMWENLGRVAFEFPQVSKMNVYSDPDRFEVVGAENIALLEGDDQCGIFFSGHLANWEFCALGCAQHSPPVPVHLIYREPDNAHMRKLFAKRKPTPECGLIPKGSKGAREALNVLKKGGHLAMLVDQKMNDGISVPFFGREAMTAPAIAQFALKYDCPIVPVRIERLGGVKFRITFFEPMEINKTGNRKDDMLLIMTEINKMLEDWISERPEQWLWLHRRWPKD
ncbi:Lauroyl/myristoyl acyltransferase [Candidatus Terasakiella magnetica]|uniref:Lauroyl/myristoyl acyltransferase n=1 Tax=Candidatus Terasakiella magnetica TaxID=1867952 RepID=A0A1C3RF65_9PROT|nr:lauroyl acyltransferase [Candidatus Terasakiella magnetica]SCA55854.1 Lauroyl/myristoyl acyltransferase [Candidatus Terasakiella magnetica]